MLSMKGNGSDKREFVRGGECRYGLMGQGMRGGGLIIKLMDRGGLFMLMGMYMKVRGWMIKLMDLANTLTQMGQFMTENGRTTSKMVKESNVGQMVLTIKDLMFKE